MKASSLLCAVLFISAAQAAWAQEAGADAPPQPATLLRPPLPASDSFSPPNLSLPSVTPEMWLYSQQWRRHDDPAQAVRRKAEAKAAQRAERLAALKWYGFSNQRPQASPTPFMGVYSPAWTGNGWNRYDWVGPIYPTTTLYIDGYPYVR